MLLNTHDLTICLFENQQEIIVKKAGKTSGKNQPQNLLSKVILHLHWFPVVNFDSLQRTGGKANLPKHGKNGEELNKFFATLQSCDRISPLHGLKKSLVLSEMDLVGGYHPSPWINLKLPPSWIKKGKKIVNPQKSNKVRLVLSDWSKWVSETKKKSFAFQTDFTILRMQRNRHKLQSAV